MHKNTLILVVEDEDEIADILMSYLERSGMKTLRASQGEQAIALNRLHKPVLSQLLWFPHSIRMSINSWG